MHLNHLVRHMRSSFLPEGLSKAMSLWEEYDNFPMGSNRLYYYLDVMY